MSVTNVSEVSVFKSTSKLLDPTIPSTVVREHRESTESTEREKERERERAQRVQREQKEYRESTKSIHREHTHMQRGDCRASKQQ